MQDVGYLSDPRRTEPAGPRISVIEEQCLTDMWRYLTANCKTETEADHGQLPPDAAVADIKVFLLAVMGCQDIPYMKAPNDRSASVSPIRANTSEYGMLSPSKRKAVAPLPRDRLGVFLDQGEGARLLLTSEEIRWVNKQFFLMQLARDEFVVKYSILSNLSPETIKERKKGASDHKFKPAFCNKSLKIVQSA